MPTHSFAGAIAGKVKGSRALQAVIAMAVFAMVASAWVGGGGGRCQPRACQR